MWDASRQACTRFTPRECYNYFAVTT
jgi:hypothetical protein